MLKRKREEYFGFIEQYYHSRTDEHYKDTYRQVMLPRRALKPPLAGVSGQRGGRLQETRFDSHLNVLPSCQIHIDIPRTNPLIPLFQQPAVQEVRGAEHRVVA